MIEEAVHNNPYYVLEENCVTLAIANKKRVFCSILFIILYAEKCTGYTVA